MIKKLLYTLFISLFCSIYYPTKAAPIKINQVGTEQTQSPVFVLRKFKEDLNKKYTGKEFDYTLTVPRESLWSKFQRSLRRVISKILSNADGETINKVTIIVLYTFCGIIICVLLYYLTKILTKKEGNFFFSKKNEKAEIHNEDIIEDINEIDFNKTIAQYELEKDYRSAFRYQFLALLKALTDSKKIEWTPEKTNWDYLNELSNKTEQTYFEQAVYIFDYVWYGDFKITERDYKKFITELKLLNPQQ